MHIVSPPRQTSETRLRRLAKTVPHILTHKPFNPYCDICKQAKLREPPHKKGGAELVIENAKEFGDYSTGDVLASKEETMRGVGGYHDALNLRDMGSGVKMCYPTFGRNHLDSGS